MLSSGRVVRLTCMRSIRCYECGEERGVWWFTASLLPSKRRRGKSVWVMRGFKFPLSLSLSLSLSQSWDFLSVGVVCLLLICSAVEKFVFYIVFLFWSDQIRFSLFFTAKLTDRPKKLLLIIFIFWQISSTFRYALILCAEAPFSTLKKVSAPITSGLCSRGRQLQSLFCVYDKLEEIFFGHITMLKVSVLLWEILLLVVTSCLLIFLVYAMIVSQYMDW